jgi:hypothetical protein
LGEVELVNPSQEPIYGPRYCPQPVGNGPHTGYATERQNATQYQSHMVA